MIPVDAIDPDKLRHEWVHRFEYHVDLLPPLMEAIIMMTLPSIPASRTDQVRVSGGGFVDNVPLVEIDNRAVSDATGLWGVVVEYVRAVGAWIGENPITVSDAPNPDPLSARAVMLTVAGWLIDRAEQVMLISQLDDYREAMFTLIRSLRARYGVFAHGRRPKGRCGVCGARRVDVVWVTDPKSQRPVRAGRCGECGDTVFGVPDPAPVVRVPRVVLSEACADLVHEACRSVHCECSCGHVFPHAAKAGDAGHEPTGLEQ